jgi:hypothetical protein
MQLPRKRAVLTTQQAAEIFNLQGPSLISHILSGGCIFSSRSVAVAKMFGVSPKAVRDIWNKRTWRHSTSHLFPENERESCTDCLKTVENMVSHHMIAQRKSVGRPRGSKDSKPRRSRRQHRSDVTIIDNIRFASKESAALYCIHEHESGSNFTSLQQSLPLWTSAEPTRELQLPEFNSDFQSTAQFYPVSCAPTMVAGLSMPHWDHLLADDAVGPDEGDDARSYPFFLQF